jgi:hypothetical protein
MKLKRTIITSLCALTFLACDKVPPPASKSGNLTSLLPANTVGFMSGDFQNPELRAYTSSPEYRTFMEGVRSGVEANKAAGDFTTYFNVVEALGIMPGKDGGPLPFGECLMYVGVDEQKSPEVSVVYEVVGGTDGRALVGKAK